jgi:glycosyltransferase involved in cell wall biosynthesis
MRREMGKNLSKKQYKVLHIGKFYPPHMGGMEVYLQQLVSGQSKVMDVAAVVASDLRSTQLEFVDGAKIVRGATFGSVASMPIVPMLAWHIRRHPSDLIHMNTPNPGAAFALLVSRHPGKLIITHHADTLGRKQLRRMSDPCVRRIMARAAAIIVTSKGYLESSEELAPYRNKCHIIPLGIDLTPFERPHTAESKDIRTRYGNRLILAVGRLVPYKGFDYLIRSMKSVQGVLLLIGTGPLREALLRSVEECGVQGKVILLGHVDEIAPYYKAASMVVIPSITRAEAFGVVQLEAMASGIPVINTDIPSGVPEVSIHGQTGFTVPPKDAEALANAINLLLDDEELRQKFGRVARERVRNKFSVESMVAQTMDLYASVLASPSVI